MRKLFADHFAPMQLSGGLKSLFELLRYPYAFIVLTDKNESCINFILNITTYILRIKR
jgi:hypothetical protein